MSTDASRSRPSRWSRLRRWIVRLCVLAVVAIAIVIVAVEVTLRSDLVRSVAADVLSAQTGLRVEIDEARATWFNGTVVKGVRIGLPFEPDDLASIDQIDIAHASLPALAISRNLEDMRIQVDRADVRVAPDETGTWNIADAIQIITEAQRGKPSSGGAAPALPQVDVDALQVTVVQPTGDQTLPVVALSFVPIGNHEYTIEGEVGDRARISGELAPRAGWSHRVQVVGSELETLASLFVPEAKLPSVEVAAQWTGRRSGDQLIGRLALERAQVGDYAAAGDLPMTIGAGTLAVTSPRIRLTGVAGVVPELDTLLIDSGTIAWRDQKIHATDVGFSTGRERGLVSGTVHPATLAADPNARWDAKRDDLVHAGTARLSYVPDALGPAALTLTSTVEARQRNSAIDVDFQVDALVGTDGSIEARVRADRLLARRDELAMNLSGLEATADYDGTTVSVSNLRDPADQIRGDVAYDLATRVWRANLVSDDWPLDGFDLAPERVEVAARGDATSAHFDLLRIQSAAGTAELIGSLAWNAASEQPAVLGDIELSMIPPTDDENEDDVVPAVPNVSTWDETVLTVRVEGPLDPLQLSLDGLLTAHGVQYETKSWQKVAIPLTAQIKPDTVRIETGDVNILDGRLRLQGDLDLASRDLRAHVDGFNLNLATVAALLQSDVEVDGTLDVNAELRLPRLDPKASEIWGDWSLRDAKLTDVRVDHGHGQFKTIDGWIELQDLVIVRDASEVTGSARFDPARSLLEFNATTRNWAVALAEADVDAIVDGDIEGRWDLVAGDGRGEGHVSAQVTRAGHPIGPVSSEVRFDRRSISLDQVKASWFNGVITGDALIVRDNLYDSSLNLVCEDVDLAQVALQVPGADRLSGIGRGTVELAPARDARAMEPLRLASAFTLTEARLGEVPLESGEIRAYFGPTRWVLDLGRFNFAGGTLNTWARVSRRDAEPHWFVDASFENLRLRPFLLEAGVLPEDRPLQGRLRGSFSGSGAVQAPHRAFGQGRVELSKTDLVAIPAVEALYGLLSLKSGGSTPQGEGVATFRLEDDRLEMVRLEYFNRGVDIVARLVLGDIWAGSASPIEGFAVGVIRPLRDSSFSWLREMDEGFKAIQSETGAVRIQGTVGDAEVEPVPFESVTRALAAALSR